MLPLCLHNTSHSILPAARLSRLPSLSASRVPLSSFPPSPCPHALLTLPPSLDYPPLCINLPPFGLVSSLFQPSISSTSTSSSSSSFSLPPLLPPSLPHFGLCRSAAISVLFTHCGKTTHYGRQGGGGAEVVGLTL